MSRFVITRTNFDDTFDEYIRQVATSSDPTQYAAEHVDQLDYIYRHVFDHVRLELTDTLAEVCRGHEAQVVRLAMPDVIDFTVRRYDPTQLIEFKPHELLVVGDREVIEVLRGLLAE